MTPKTVRDTLAASIPVGGVPRTWDRPAGEKVLVILITPRSGSTWLGDVMTKTGKLGFPEEYINPDCLPDTNVELCAAEEIDYLNGLIDSRRSPNGVFSLEITWGDIERFSTVDVLDYFREARYVYLRRRNVLEQAISLMLAVNTGVFHIRDGRAVGPDHMRQVKPAEFCVTPTDPSMHLEIRKWIGHIVNYECQAELQFSIRGIKPMRVYYEDLPNTMNRVLAHISSLVEEVLPEIPPQETDLSQTRTPLSLDIRDAFVRGNSEFLLTIAAIRPPLFE